MTTDDLELQDRHAEIQKLLWNNDCEVTFKKINGEIRTMPCTLQPSAIPEFKESTREPKVETLSVWCTDKNEWRSFRVMNVTDVEVL